MEIKKIKTGEIIFSGEYSSMRECVEDAVRKKISLQRADFQEAYLQGVNLQGGVGAIQWQAPSGIKRICYSVAHGEKVIHKIGCFWGDTEEAACAIIKNYGENSLYEKIMRLNVEALQ